MNSTIQERGPVVFPPFTGERIYMREFTKHDGLPADLWRWQDTVDAMLDGADTDGPIYLMADQGFVRAGETHRRPGVHVDGYWNPGLMAHGQPRPSHVPYPPQRPQPKPFPRHSLQAQGRHGHRFDGAESEILAIASDVLGCRAFVGDYEGTPAEGGDCAHIDVSELLAVDCGPGRVWVGETGTMLHEAIPVTRDVPRTVVRLNIPIIQATASLRAQRNDPS